MGLEASGARGQAVDPVAKYHVCDPRRLAVGLTDDAEFKLVAVGRHTKDRAADTLGPAPLGVLLFQLEEDGLSCGGEELQDDSAAVGDACLLGQLAVQGCKVPEGRVHV